MARDTTRAAIGSFAFFLLAPGVNAGLVPWLITRWETDARSGRRRPGSR